MFDWQTLPESVAVIGGGVIALELAQALDRLGVRVKVLARDHRLGPLTDPALSAKTLSVFKDELDVIEDASDIRLVRDGEYAEHIEERMREGGGALFGDLAPIRALEEFLERAVAR